jgi:hypothetical protein
MRASSEGILIAEVEGAPADIAAAAAAIRADGGTVLSVEAAPVAGEGTYAARIAYVPGAPPTA